MKTQQTQLEPFELRNYAGAVATFTAEAGVSVRVMLPHRIAYMSEQETRDLAAWLLLAADAIAPPASKKTPRRRKETKNITADDGTAVG